jgi:hypothetical protein
VPAQPTCGPLTGTPCGGGTGGGNGPPVGAPAAGLVALVPVRWFLAKRKRKRS